MSSTYSFLNWFDITNKEHLRALGEYLDTNSWPAHFIPADIQMELNWKPELFAKIAKHHIKSVTTVSDDELISLDVDDDLGAQLLMIPDVDDVDDVDDDLGAQLLSEIMSDSPGSQSINNETSDDTSENEASLDAKALLADIDAAVLAFEDSPLRQSGSGKINLDT